MNDLNQIGQLLKAGQYHDVLKLLNKEFPSHLPSSELVKIASFCEVNINQFEKAISRLSQALIRFKDDVGLLISLSFAYAKSGDVENASKTVSRLTPQTLLNASHVHELLFLLREFTLRRYAVKSVVSAIYSNSQQSYGNDEKVLSQLLHSAKQAQLWETALTISNKLYQRLKKDTFIIEQAIALRFLNRPSDAIALLEKLTSSLNHFAVFHNLANVYSDIGELQKALVYYEKAIRLNPDYVESLVNHAKVSFELGNTTTWLNLFEKIIKQKAHSVAHCIAYINLLIEGKDYPKAITTIEQLADENNQPIYALLKAKALRLDNKPDEALAVLEPFAQRNIAEVNLELSEIALTLKNTALAAQQLEAVKKNAPLNFSMQQIVKSNTYIVDRLLELPIAPSLQQAVWQRTVRETEVPMSAIREHLETLHGDLSSPVNQSVQRGTQTRGNLFPTNNSNLNALEAFIKHQIVDFISENASYLSVENNNTLTADMIEFSGSWSVLNKFDGYHVPHYHSNGLVSGVFYVDVPKDLSEHDVSGHLHLGRVDKTPFYLIDHFTTVKPENGKLVLFPSHAWHGTFPTEREGNRLTIAFDAIIS
ncbi:tetratricopeptide repeat protein [Alteromonas sp. McT4-15]|uniref:2OG-Fe(II) oxygenase family protein n=1 Tax=Alteromonas sp. McT4-15 TaxID=2881256 RepID=UPI001CF828D5|nr:putative 2OG-Fe(II) oxygenase [Alteromonas sp. McT4-15]MCB4436932.1 tetratricopeptide repeat protein [Alteromonas sp. McT4-15]